MPARTRLEPTRTGTHTAANYRKPPKASQFKPGQSGNPKGRPKGVRNLKTDLEEALRAPVNVTTKRGNRQITTQRAMFERLGEKAWGGDVRAIQQLISLALRLLDDRTEVPASVLERNDLEILDEYYEERKALEADRAASGSIEPEPSMANPARKGSA